MLEMTLKKTLLLVFILSSLFHFCISHEEHEHGDLNIATSRVSHRSLNNFEVVNSRIQTRWTSKTSKRSMLEENKLPQPYPDQLSLSLNAFGKKFLFDLKINENLLSQDTRVTIYTANGVITKSPTHRFYYGTVRAEDNEETGIARLTLLGSADQDSLSFFGHFDLSGESYYVKESEHFLRMKAEVKRNRERASEPDVDMVIYRKSDIEIHDEDAEKCGVEGDHFDIMDLPERSPYSFTRRQDVETPLGRRAIPADCPAKAKVLYMGIASDCTYSSIFPLDAKLEEDLLGNWNSASSKFEETFNIGLGVVDIVIRRECGTNPPDSRGGVLTWNQQCSSGYTISTRLSDFSRWRGNQPPDAGLWHLMSKCNTDSTVGIAWLNMLCQTSSFDQTVNSKTEYVSGTGVSTVVDEQWIVIAHEIGHNFGSKHDCTSSCTNGQTTCCNCSPNCNCEGKYIMNPTNGITTDDFSPCTQSLVCYRSSLTGSCLAEPGTRTVKNAGVCGNGIWEPPAEQCDCGGDISCLNDTCCFSNCTLKAGAQCSDFNSKCCVNCQNLTSTTTICREKDGECDVDEYCDGKNAVCPQDKYVEDGKVCGNSSETYCASGQCTNRDLQCINIGIINDNPTYKSACLDSCKIFCKSDFEGCRYFTGVFLNGTTCGKSGRCQGGVCSESDFVGTLIDFIRDNLVLFIVGVCIVGILLLVFLAWGCKQANRKKITNVGSTMRGLARGVQATIRGKRGGPPPSQQKGGRPSNAQAQKRASVQPREHAQRSSQRPPSHIGPSAFNPDYVEPSTSTFMEELPDHRASQYHS